MYHLCFIKSSLGQKLYPSSGSNPHIQGKRRLFCCELCVTQFYPSKYLQIYIDVHLLLYHLQECHVCILIFCSQLCCLSIHKVWSGKHCSSVIPLHHIQSSVTITPPLSTSTLVKLVSPPTATSSLKNDDIYLAAQTLSYSHT